MVRIEGAHKSYLSGEVKQPVLIDASLKINQGDFVSIVGPSGCGKSTLLNLMGALDQADEGEVWVDGINLTQARASDLAKVRRQKIGFIFQFFNLISNLTVLENVELGLEAMGGRQNGRKERAMQYLDLVGLQHVLHKFSDQLSGGEQQRVAIARALAKEPALILADEPTGNLDEENATKMAELMRSLHSKLSATFVLVTHNPSLAKGADKTYRLSKGKVCEIPKSSA